MSAALPWAVLAPFLGAAAAALGGRRVGLIAGALTALASLALALALAVEAVGEGRPVVEEIGGWAAPLGISLRGDGMGATMLLLIAVVGLAVTAYAPAYLRAAGEAAPGWSADRAFWPIWLLLWGGLAALVVSADVFNAFVALEVVSLSAVGLVLLAGGTGALEGGTRYLLAAWLGSSLYLLGVALLYGAFETLDMGLLAERVDDSPAAVAALALMTAGLMLKAALFPLHFWLPGAHANAPAPVSAALSGLVVTGAFVVMVRLWSEALVGAVTPAAATAVGALAAAAILWGSAVAVRQRRLKPLVAYSTVGQLGYLFLLIPLAAAPLALAPGTAGRAAADGWSGGLYYAVSHGVAKAALFLAAGCMIHAVGSERLEDLAGLASRLPVSVFAFGIAGVALVGLPPSGGFVAKWYLVSAAVRAGEPWWAAVVLGGSLLTAAYLLAVLRPALAVARRPVRLRPVPRAMEAAAMGLALVGLALGLRATEALELLAVGRGGLP